MFDIEKVIREYIPEVIHMSLATCLDNKPWVCEVHYAYDDNLNFYFWSKPSSRHCTEMAMNPNVSGNIVEQHDGTMKPRGVYFEGTAEELNDVTEDDVAFKVYSARFDRDKDMLDETKEENGHRFYKITVDTFYLFDSRESKPSKKYELSWK